MRCEKCGKNNDDKAIVCTHCGASFSERRKKRRTEGIIVAIVLVLIVAATAVGCFFLFGNMQNSGADMGDGGEVSSDLDSRPCFYCGNADHTGNEHPVCKKCGSNIHATAEHPNKCSICGSVEHVVHPSGKACNHIKGSYLWYEEAHPHYNYFKCKICGEPFTDGSTGKVESCDKCYVACATCGSTSHTTANHPKCSVCGSKEHDVYSHEHACAKCGKLDHKTEEHPCDVCGSVDHREHPKCGICESPYHTSDQHPFCQDCGSHKHTSCCTICGMTDHRADEHPCDDCGTPGCEERDWCDECATHDHTSDNCPEKRPDKPLISTQDAIVPSLY